MSTSLSRHSKLGLASMTARYSAMPRPTTLPGLAKSSPARRILGRLLRHLGRRA